LPKPLPSFTECLCGFTAGYFKKIERCFMDYRMSLVGLLTGLLIGLTGMGGGAILVPLLILIFRVPPLWAVGTDLTYCTVTKAVGSFVHMRQKHVHFGAVLWLACGSIPATFLSVWLAQSLHKHIGKTSDGMIVHIIGYTLLFVAILLLIKPRLMRWLDRRSQNLHKERLIAGEAMLAESQASWQRVYRPLLMIFIGAVVGFLVGLTSVGSGALIIVSLAFLFPHLTTKELVGTDVFQAFLLMASGTVGYATAGTIHWTLVGLLLLGSIPGVLIGSSLSKYVPERIMQPLLVVVLAISGWKLI
jgi:uncharacterized protein